MLRPRAEPGRRHPGRSGHARPGGRHLAGLLPHNIAALSAVVLRLEMRATILVYGKTWLSRTRIDGLSDGPQPPPRRTRGRALVAHQPTKRANSRTTEKGVFCDTPKEVAEQADCIFLCVGDTAMAQEVILGADGMIAGRRARDRRRGRQHHQPEREPRRSARRSKPRASIFWTLPAPVRRPAPRAAP